MEYAKDLVISDFDLLMANEYGNWSIGSISQEEYFELRIAHIHHHCPTSVDAARDIVDYFTGKGVSINRYHKPGSDGILFLKKEPLS